MRERSSSVQVGSRVENRVLIDICTCVVSQRFSKRSAVQSLKDHTGYQAREVGFTIFLVQAAIFSA